VSEVVESQAVSGGLAGGSPARAPTGRTLTAISIVIVATTALALALRVYYQSTRAGFLLGVTEYDDGPYFGSALRLAAGVLPYRDFYMVQPPGITLLMAPVALLARAIGTNIGLELARILTTLASGAGVVMAGFLVRRYGTLAVLITCGIIAVHPESIAAAHTVLVEPWLVVFCLIGALALINGDELATGRRLVWAGVAFGFGGAVEAWAIVPVIVAILLFLPKVRRSWPFCAGVAAGFLVPVLPFLALGPKQFYQSVIVAQLDRVKPARTPVWGRLANIIGITKPTPGQQTLVLILAVAVAVAVVAMIVVASRLSHSPAPLLERFVVLTSALVVVMFCLADQFYYHFVAFLVPFLAASIALPAARLLAAIAARRPTGGGIGWRLATGVAVAGVLAVAVTQFQAESVKANVIGPVPRAIERTIPPGACVLTDQVSMTIMAKRFYSTVPGCSQMIDGLATDLALSNGRKPSDGAGNVPAVAQVWRQAFAHAQFVLLSANNAGRIAWTPALRAYFQNNFYPVPSRWKRVTLYERKGLVLH
jgi:hypothetical protein